MWFYSCVVRSSRLFLFQRCGAISLPSQSTGENKPISYLQNVPVLPPSGLFAGPNANSPVVLHGPIVHCRDNVATAAAMVTLWAMPTPGASATIKPKINIVFPATFTIQHLEPVWANLPHNVVPAFLLYLFCICNCLRQLYPPLSSTIGSRRLARLSVFAGR